MIASGRYIYSQPRSTKAIGQQVQDYFFNHLEGNISFSFSVGVAELERFKLACEPSGWECLPEYKANVFQRNAEMALST